MDRRFVLVVAMLAVLTVPMVLVTAIPLLAVVFFVAGVAIAPVITTGSTLVEALVPAHGLTEGLAWTNTAMSLTYALSAAVAGAVIDRFGPQAGFVVPVASGLIAGVAAVLGGSRLRLAPRAPLADGSGAASAASS